jgi:hypothetical protein
MVAWHMMVRVKKLTLSPHLSWKRSVSPKARIVMRPLMVSFCVPDQWQTTQPLNGSMQYCSMR